MADTKQLAADVVRQCREFVSRKLAEIIPSIDALKKRLDEMPVPKDGTPGRDGVDGNDGAPGERGAPGDPGQDGAAGADGKDGAPGAQGLQGDKGDQGEKGDPGEKGEQGAPGDAGAAGKDGRDGMDGAAGRDGVDGKDGARGERGETGERGEKGDSGERGEQGPQGEAGLPGERGERGERGEKGLDGTAGRDGEDGRDALELEVLSMIDDSKRYRRGTYASHRGGLWRSVKTTEGMDGWECLVDGDADDEIELGADLRTFTLRKIKSSGRVIERTFALPVVIHRGVFKAEQQYEPGDATTWDGSTWIAQQPTKDKPGTSDAWRLSTKRGRDGRDGIRGEKGERGAEGRAGRDLTQTDGKGNKW